MWLRSWRDPAKMLGWVNPGHSLREKYVLHPMDLCDDVPMKLPHRIIVGALIGATVFKLYLALATQGSLDADGFLDHLQKIRELGVGAYNVRGAFNNPFNSPPPMIHLIKLWGWLADSTGIRFQFWLRLPSILADIGTFVLVASFLRKVWPTKISFGVLLALAVCPTAILISGYHGNTDSLMIFLVVLSIYFVETDRLQWLAGIVFGLAVCVKVLPLCFLPAVFFYQDGLRRRLQFFAAAALTFVLCSMPYLAQDPKVIWSTVFGYASIYGHWGWSLLALLTFPDLPTYLHKPFDVQGTHAIFAQILKLMTITLIVLVSIWFNRRPPKPSLFFQCGLITAIVLFMAPGFGIQYLVWLVPFVAALALRLSLLYYCVSALYLSSQYICYAFSKCLPPLVGLTVSVICWVVVFVLILAFRRALNRQTAKAMAEA